MPFFRKRDTPADGDFAARIEQQARVAKVGLDPPSAPMRGQPDSAAPTATPPPAAGTTLEGVLFHGEEPTDEFLEELETVNNAPELSDEDLTNQALSAKGSDGDPSTPE